MGSAPGGECAWTRSSGAQGRGTLRVGEHGHSGSSLGRSGGGGRASRYRGRVLREIHIEDGKPRAPLNIQSCDSDKVTRTCAVFLSLALLLKVQTPSGQNAAMGTATLRAAGTCGGDLRELC